MRTRSARDRWRFPRGTKHEIYVCDLHCPLIGAESVRKKSGERVRKQNVGRNFGLEIGKIPSRPAVWTRKAHKRIPPTCALNNRFSNTQTHADTLSIIPAVCQSTSGARTRTTHTHTHTHKKHSKAHTRICFDMPPTLREDFVH